LPTQAPARKPYRRSSIRQQPRIYRGPAINELGVLGNRFGSLAFQIGSLESEKSGPRRSIPGT